MTTVQPGSFGVVRTSGFVGWAIRLFTRSQVNHAFIVISDAGDTIEAEAKGATFGNVADYAGCLVAYNDLQPLTDAQRSALVDSARKLVGIPYGFLDLVAIALRLLGLDWKWLAKRVESSRTLICSQLVDRAYKDAGLPLAGLAQMDGQVTPGDLLLYIAQHRWVASG